MDFTRPRTAINRRKATYEDSELTRNSLTSLIRRIHDSGEKQRTAWGKSSYLKSMLRNRAMGESCLSLSPNQSTRTPSAETGCKSAFQKATVDESVDCAVEYFHAGRFLTRTS